LQFPTDDITAAENFDFVSKSLKNGGFLDSNFAILNRNYYIPTKGFSGNFQQSKNGAVSSCLLLPCRATTLD